MRIERILPALPIVVVTMIVFVLGGLAGASMNRDDTAHALTVSVVTPPPPEVSPTPTPTPSVMSEGERWDRATSANRLPRTIVPEAARYLRKGNSFHVTVEHITGEAPYAPPHYLDDSRPKVITAVGDEFFIFLNRYAVHQLQQDGYTCVSSVLLAKPEHLPDSVTERELLMSECNMSTAVAMTIVLPEPK